MIANTTVRRAAAALFVLLSAGNSNGQDLEPRRWSHLPIDTNFGGVGFARTTGDITLNPVLKIEDGEVEMDTIVGKYIRTFEAFGKSTRFDIVQAYQSGEWKGLLDGTPASVERNGASDTFIRMAMNLYGAPPMNGKEFADYRASTDCETIVGIALGIHLPTGSYYEDKLINLGSNRFTFRPQLGVVRNFGKWSTELTGSTWIFTDNDSFSGGKTLAQDPLVTVQTHVSYTFSPGLWLTAGVGYGFNGESSVNSVSSNDTKSNFAWTVALGLPINPQLGVKIGYLGIRTLEDTGSDLDTFSLGLSAIW